MTRTLTRDTGLLYRRLLLHGEMVSDMVEIGVSDILAQTQLAQTHQEQNVRRGVIQKLKCAAATHPSHNSSMRIGRSSSPLPSFHRSCPHSFSTRRRFSSLWLKKQVGTASHRL